MFLEIGNLSKMFGGLKAVDEFNLKIKKGDIVGLIGPNGAGKTTLFNLITGVYKPNKGRVMYNGQNITGKKPHQIAKLGIGRTFQLNPLFSDFTVLENVTTAFYLHPKSKVFDIFFNTPTYRKNEAYIREQAAEILHFVGLDQMKDELARNLPHGYQKMLGIARALATNPKLLMLDEPLGGMNPSEIEFTLSNIKRTREKGVTLLIVEHNMQILDLCDYVVVISFGQKICEGPPQSVREDKQVINAYFGSEYVSQH